MTYLSVIIFFNNFPFLIQVEPNVLIASENSAE